MDYKEKYEMALEGIQEILGSGEDSIKMSRLQQRLQGIFPELKESEDEKIRQFLIHEVTETSDEIMSYRNMNKKDVLAWLEKQGEQKTAKYNNSILKDKLLELFQRFRWYCKDETPTNGDIIDYVDAHIQELIDTIQKPTDKVEPKFKQGEWITNGDYTWQIVNVTDLDYILQSQDGHIVYDTISHVDEHFHSFTIEDAKDGDVLACDDKDKVFLYNGKLDLRGRVCAYCGIYKTYDGLRFTECAIGNYFTYKEPYPATKEQRDLLFSKMKESGYQWNDEKKVLKKIDQTDVIEIPFGANDSELQEATYYIPKGFHAKIEGDKVVIKKGEQKPAIIIPKFIVGDEIKTANEEVLTITKIDEKGYWSEDLFICSFDDANKWKLVEQKPAWSEEDELRMENILSVIEGHGYPMEVEWIKSIKDRIHPNQEWSEDDEMMIKFALTHFRLEGATEDSDIIKWLKSLRPQKQWKPTEGQMGVIEAVINNRSFQRRHLDSLYEQLKKLI